MDDKEGRELNRRDFIRRAAVTGAAAAFAAPVIQTVAATPAFAGTTGSPAPGGCFHSSDTPGEGCMESCTGNSNLPCLGNQCDGFGQPPFGPCSRYCHISPGNQCCNSGLCNPANFTCPAGTPLGGAIYSGFLTGC
jgi:hypothetical protein